MDGRDDAEAADWPEWPEWPDHVAVRLGRQLPALGLGVLLIERGGRVIDADPVAVELLGRSQAELRAVADVSTLLAPEERFKRTAYRERRRRGAGGDERFHTVVARPDGDRLPVEATILPIGDGAVTAIVIRNVSEIAARDQLIDWYAALVERMPIGVVIMDATGVDDPRDIRIWSANDAASVSAGRDLGLYAGRTMADMFPSARRFGEAHRALALRDTGRVEQFPDIVVGDPDAPTAVYRRTVVSLPEGGIALLVDDITRERLDDLRHRRLAERIVQLSDAERRLIAMGIHDDPIQQIAAAALLVSQLRRKGGPSRPEWLEDIERSLHRATASLRELVFELIPPELVESGLATAISSSFDHLFADTAVRADIRCELVEEPPHAVQSTVFRIVAEALTNIRKHAQASQVVVCVRSESGTLLVDVSDDGVGISAGERPGHVGLRSMYDRAAALGGEATVHSSSAGTTVSARIPLDHTPVDRSDDDRAPIAAVVNDLDRVADSLRRQRDGLVEAHSVAAAEAERARRRMSTITDVSRLLRDSPASRLERARCAARAVADAVSDGCAIRLLTADGGTLERVASWHPDPSQLEFLDRWLFIDRPVGGSHSGAVHHSAQPVLIDRERVDWMESDGPVPPPAPTEPHTAIVAPLHRGADVIGTLTVVRDVTVERLTTDDLGWVGAIADVVAAAISSCHRDITP
jgi:PAS domain S-box-containing protein